MADYRFILQGLEQDNDHLAAVEEVFALDSVQKGLIASAFMNAAGASVIANCIAQFTNSIKVFVGIRNGVTTLQAIHHLREHSIYPYLVDTASQSYIFHPKVYLACNTSHARAIIGSANATSGGLTKNVEGSFIGKFDLSEQKEREMVQSVFDAFERLLADYPDNIVQITDETNLDELVQMGLLVDERSVNWKSTSSATGTSKVSGRKRMKLHTRSILQNKKAAFEPEEHIAVTGTTIVVPTVSNRQLLWKSVALTRRDLNIPTGESTNKTGSMLLKRGNPEQNIDHRSFFRDIVFATANWQFDTRPGKEHLERCTCQFRIIIRGINYGIFDLKLTHNTKTDTKAYKQKNSMTQIHWGQVTSLVAKENLLDCILYLYAPTSDETAYTIVIDDE